MPSSTRDDVFSIPSPAAKKRRRDDDHLMMYETTVEPSRVPVPPTDRVAHRPSNASLIHNDTPINRTFDPIATWGYQHEMPRGVGGPGGGAGFAARKIYPVASLSKKARLDPVMDQHAAGALFRPLADLKETDVNTARKAPPVRMTTAQYKLSNCHICGRRPVKKADIDAYADCQGCGRRTCYVCIRQCLGWTGEDEDLAALDRLPSTPSNLAGAKGAHAAEQGRHGQHDRAMDNVHPSPGHGVEHDKFMSDPPTADSQQDKAMFDEVPVRAAAAAGAHQHAGWSIGRHHEVICSQCCVEKGVDGDVVCLGCLPYV